MLLSEEYELEQPVQIHLDHDDVLASGDGCVYVHDPFPMVREGLYLFNHERSFKPGVCALECFVRFDSFKRPQIVPKEKATHVFTREPAVDGTGSYETIPSFRRWVSIHSNVPVRRLCSPLTEADTEYWNLDWKERRELDDFKEKMEKLPKS